MDRVEILDTTLRDGAQGEGVSFSVEDKLKIIRLLDDAGVDYIEAGNPASSMADRELFTYARDRLRLRRSRLVAFGSTVRPRLSPQDDPGLATLISCGTEYVSIVGKAVKSQTVSVLGVTPDQNLAMIRDTVSYLTRMGLNVFFDAEHFFDGFLEDGIAVHIIRVCPGRTGCPACATTGSSASRSACRPGGRNGRYRSPAPTRR